MSALGLGDSVAVGLAAGLTGAGIMALNDAQPELPLLSNLGGALAPMWRKAMQSVTVIALSAAAGNLVGRPALKYVAPMLGITVQGA